MTIKFTCDSTIEFDVASGRGKNCPHAFEVADEKAGALIECPACQNFVEVPPLPKAKPQMPTRHRKELGVPQIDALETSQSEQDLLVDAGPAVESKLSYEQFDGFAVCRKCGGRLAASQPTCPHCGAPRKQAWEESKPVDQIKPQPAGFQRWLMSLVAQEQSARSTWIVINVILIVIGVSTIGGALFVGDVLAFAIPPVVILLGFAYWRFSYHTRRIATEPAAKLTGWQRAGWNLQLLFIRSLSWKVPLSTISNPRVVSYRGTTLSDNDLSRQTDLKTADVLDLEGTGITDAGLVYLRTLTNLKYLVLRKNDLSHEEVYRLQQSIPRCWIWD